MEMKEIRAMETKKIHERLADLREKVLKLRFGVANKQVKNVREIRALKKDIARLLSALSERVNVSQPKI